MRKRAFKRETVLSELTFDESCGFGLGTRSLFPASLRRIAFLLRRFRMKERTLDGVAILTVTTVADSLFEMQFFATEFLAVVGLGAFLRPSRRMRIDAIWAFAI